MTFLDAMNTRFACKFYDNKQISHEEKKLILDYGRLTPTSFGLELWSFHAITNSALKHTLFHACFAQQSVETAALVVAVLVHTPIYADPDGAMVQSRALRFPDSLDVFIDDYRPYYDFLKAKGRLDSWLRSQGYLAVANMMTGAAMLGIQSCAIEGFDEQKVLDALDVDKRIWQVSLLCTFGYPAENVREKVRLDASLVVVEHQ